MQSYIMLNLCLLAALSAVAALEAEGLEMMGCRLEIGLYCDYYKQGHQCKHQSGNYY